MPEQGEEPRGAHEAQHGKLSNDKECEGEDASAMLEFARRMDKLMLQWARKERPREE